jgi:dipeptide/tripeptide permease
LGRLRSVGLFQAGFALAVVALAARLQWGGPGAEHLFGLLMVLYGLIGLYLAASYALYMDLTDPALSATQFTGYMSLTNVCESWSARAGGLLIASLGYAGAFGCMALGSLAALGMLVPLNGVLRHSAAAPQPKPDSGMG